MNVQLDDIIKLLEEAKDSAIQRALKPQELVHKQYAMLGEVAGIKSCIRKLEHLQRREDY